MTELILWKFTKWKNYNVWLFLLNTILVPLSGITLDRWEDGSRQSSMHKDNRHATDNWYKSVIIFSLILSSSHSVFFTLHLQFYHGFVSDQMQYQGGCDNILWLYINTAVVICVSCWVRYVTSGLQHLSHKSLWFIQLVLDVFSDVYNMQRLMFSMLHSREIYKSLRSLFFWHMLIKSPLNKSLASQSAWFYN